MGQSYENENRVKLNLIAKLRRKITKTQGTAGSSLTKSMHDIERRTHVGVHRAIALYICAAPHVGGNQSSEQQGPIHRDPRVTAGLTKHC